MALAGKLVFRSRVADFDKHKECSEHHSDYCNSELDNEMTYLGSQSRSAKLPSPLGNICISDPLTAFLLKLIHNCL